MPTYDYVCDECGHEFDAFQSIKDDPLTTCPSCSRKALRRIITGGTGVIFRGQGFYVTDSKNGGAGASVKADNDKTETETKTKTKTKTETKTETGAAKDTSTKSDSASTGSKKSA